MTITLIRDGKRQEAISSKLNENDFVSWMQTAIELGCKFESGDQCVIANFETDEHYYRYIISY